MNDSIKRVEIIQENTYNTLQNKINEFITKNEGQHCISDVRYQVFVVDDSLIRYSAMIILRSRQMKIL